METEIKGKCPACGGGLIIKERAIHCEHFNWRDKPNPKCWFDIPRTFCQHTFTTEEINTMLNGETTEEIKNFKSKAGKEFAARMRISTEQKKLECVFANNGGPQTREVMELDGKCPVCGGRLVQDGGLFRCEHHDYRRKEETCFFALWRRSSGKDNWTIADFLTLAKDGQTNVYELTNRQSEKYQGRMYLDTEAKRVRPGRDQKGPVRTDDHTQAEPPEQEPVMESQSGNLRLPEDDD